MELKKGSRDLGRELNRIAWELYPLVLDDLGLPRAVTQYLEEWSQRARLQIDLEVNHRAGTDVTFPDDLRGLASGCDLYSINFVRPFAKTRKSQSS